MLQQSSKLKLVKIIAPIVFLALLIMSYLIWGSELDFNSGEFFRGLLVGLLATFVGVWTVVLISTIIKLSSKSNQDERNSLMKKLYHSIGMLSLGLGFMLLQLHIKSLWVYGIVIILFISAIIFNVGFFFKAIK